MLALLAATRGRIKRAWLIALGHLRDVNPVEVVAARLAAGHGEPLAGMREAAAHFAAQEHAAYVAAGQTTARWLTGAIAAPTPIAKKLVGFSITDPPALEWARKNELDKIREITEAQRDAIRQIGIDAARSGEGPLVTARRIREIIGLTDKQAAAVDTYRALLARGQYAQALDRQLSSAVSDRSIAAAQAKDIELTPAQIDLAVERYRQNAIAARAETIARTEGLRIAHQGTEELYRQAVVRGDVEADELVGTWNHHPGARGKDDREFHVVMDGQERPYGEPFTSGRGVSLRYPGDPAAPASETMRCGCVVTRRIVPRNRPDS